MSHTNPQAAFLNLLASTYARYGVEIQALPPTGMRIPLPENDYGRDAFDVDYAEVVDDMMAVPEKDHPEYAEQVVFGVLRQMRSRGIALGTHYPPLSTDLPRQALLAALNARGWTARFEFPDVLLLTPTDQSTFRKDVGGLVSSLEGAEEDVVLEKALEFVMALENQLADMRSPVTSEGGPGGSEGRLRSRLYPESAFPEGVLARLVARPMASGVAEVVVLDLPDTIRPLNQTELEGLGLTAEQAFARAVEGSLNEPVDVSRMDALGTPIVHIGSGDGFYVGSQLHALARHLGEAPHGALVVFPSPPVVMAHVLGESDNPLGAMKTLQELAERFTADTDKPISDKLFWWRPESATGGRPRLAEVGVAFDEQSQKISLYTEDQEFGPLLQSLL